MKCDERIKENYEKTTQKRWEKWNRSVITYTHLCVVFHLQQKQNRTKWKRTKTRSHNQRTCNRMPTLSRALHKIIYDICSSKHFQNRHTSLYPYPPRFSIRYTIQYRDMYRTRAIPTHSLTHTQLFAFSAFHRMTLCFSLKCLQAQLLLLNVSFHRSR